MHKYSEDKHHPDGINRKCKVCRLDKTIEEFYFSSGVRMQKCKECHKFYVALWRKFHKAKVKEYENRSYSKKKQKKNATND